MMPFFLGHNEPFLAQTMANIEMIDTAEFGRDRRDRSLISLNDESPVPLISLCKGTK